SEALAHEIELEALAEHGLVYDPDEFAHHYMGMSDAMFSAALADDFEQRTGRTLPDSFPSLNRERLDAALRERLTEVAGAHAAVRAAGGVTKAVASSSEQDRLDMKLRKVG